jgi:hypothetical protein
MGGDAAVPASVPAEIRCLHRGRITRYSAACNGCSTILGSGPTRRSAVDAIHAHVLLHHKGRGFVIWREKNG